MASLRWRSGFYAELRSDSCIFRPSNAAWTPCSLHLVSHLRALSLTSPSPTRWAPTRFPSCWWRRAEPPAGPGAPSFRFTPPTRGVCSRSVAATACLSLWPTPLLWTWTRKAASSGRFSSARQSDAGLGIAHWAGKNQPDLQTLFNVCDELIWWNIKLVEPRETSPINEHRKWKTATATHREVFFSRSQTEQFASTGFVGGEEADVDK